MFKNTKQIAVTYYKVLQPLASAKSCVSYLMCAKLQLEKMVCLNPLYLQQPRCLLKNTKTNIKFLK